MSRPYDEPWGAYEAIMDVFVELTRQAEGKAVRISNRDMAAFLANAYADLTGVDVEEVYAKGERV